MHFLAQWQTAPGVWDGEKLYQAARLITESEYNHIAIDQYVGTLYGALPEFVSYSSDINMGVSLEFSPGRVPPRPLDADRDVQRHRSGQPGEHAVRCSTCSSTRRLYQEIGPTALAQGLTRTLGNEVDEFVTPALQQSLLGQPLDLATINIARGRDVGLPTWNEFREQIYDQLIQNTNNTNGSALAPYTNWADVFDHLKNPLTRRQLDRRLCPRHGHGTGPDRLGNRRGARRLPTQVPARWTISALRRRRSMTPTSTHCDLNHAAAVTFMEGTPTSHENRRSMDFHRRRPGLLGHRPVDRRPRRAAAVRRAAWAPPSATSSSTSPSASRTATASTTSSARRWAPTSATRSSQNQFADLVMEHTGLEHLNGEIFIWADATYRARRTSRHGHARLSSTLVDARRSSTSTARRCRPAPATSSSPATAATTIIIGGLGDDTIYGDAGNDTIQGSQGNDHLFGGDGDDYITDDENDDFITGGAGNDRIFAGGGALDTVFGDEGDDELHGGDGIDEVLGGAGDDMIYGDGDTDVLFGDDGNDYLDGGDSVDEMQGQAGNDWLRGGVGDDHLMGGDGNDLLEGGIGPTANDGDRLVGQGVIDFAPAGTVEDDLGIDVASYEDVDIAITANLHTSNENGTGGLLDTYAGIDGLVGSRFNDNLTGADTDTTTTNGFDNLLVGGGGNDILDWPRRRRHHRRRQRRRAKNDLSVYLGRGVGYTVVANWKGTGDDRPDFGAARRPRPLSSAKRWRRSAPADKAVFSGLAQRLHVTNNIALNGTLSLVDNRGIDSTASGDIVQGRRTVPVLRRQRRNRQLTLAQLLNAAPTDIQWNGVTPGQSDLPGAGAVIANLSTVDPDSASWTYTLQAGSSAGFAVSAAGVVTRTGLGDGRQHHLYPRHPFDGRWRKIPRRDLQHPHERQRQAQTSAAFATANDDIIYGDDGNDTLAGGDGNDTLFGMDEDDTLDGGLGNDVLNGGTGDTDTATYAGATGSVDVNLATGLATGADGNDTLVSIENVTGSGFDDTLTGNGSDNVLSGGLGSDTYRFGLSSGDDDTINETGGTADRIVILTGGAALTSLSFSDDNTGTTNGNLDISFNGQQISAIDHFDTGNAESIEWINFDNGSFAGYQFGTGDYAISSADPTGATRTVSVAASTANNLLAGESGANNMTGGSGNDLMFGAGGNDTLNGGDGADLLVGGSNNDVLNGGAGTDTLIGGTSQDTMTGGADADSFVFDDGYSGNSSGSRDIITDFEVGVDKIDLSLWDANTSSGNAGDQNFTALLSNAGHTPVAFTGNAQLRYYWVDLAGTANDRTIVEGNTTGGAGSGQEFQIELVGLHNLTAADFIF